MFSASIDLNEKVDFKMNEHTRARSRTQRRRTRGRREYKLRVAGKNFDLSGRFKMVRTRKELLAALASLLFAQA